MAFCCREIALCVKETPGVNLWEFFLLLSSFFRNYLVSPSFFRNFAA